MNKVKKKLQISTNKTMIMTIYIDWFSDLYIKLWQD